MKKIHAQASFGYANATYEEDFEFSDEYTDDDIEREIWEWAEQFVEIDYEIEEK